MDYGEFPHILAGLIYAVFCTCFIFSTNEFQAAGLTVESVFSKFIRDEKSDFILHHIQRMCYTLMVHTILPCGYVLLHMKMTNSGFEIFKLNPDGPWGPMCLSLYCHASLLVPMMTYIYICYWKRGNFHCHPIREQLESFITQAEPSWHLIAVSISNEFRRNDTLVLSLGTTGRLVVTQSWLIKVSMYNVQFALQRQCTVTCVDSDVHGISSDGLQNVQYLTMRVEHTGPNISLRRDGGEGFSFRINSVDYSTLSDHLRNTSITILPHVSFHKSRLQSFLVEFRAFIASNPVHSVEEEPELCIGCMNDRAEVKLVKLCEESRERENQCGSCQCRPMWCIECMGKWYALRQDQNSPHTWMSAQCTCPMCRATFCLVDVCPVRKRTPES
uniref:E3 ubiquitin-protein ligase TM129 n=1 Tax=Cacopsylla melanoneura TaxID=428564 RepID=A0A8D9BRW9_9HEMI